MNTFIIVNSYFMVFLIGFVVGMLVSKGILVDK